MSLVFLAANREGEEAARRLVDSALEAEQPLWYGAYRKLGVRSRAELAPLLGKRDLGAQQP